MLVFEAVLGSIFCFGVVRDYGVDLEIILPVLAPALAAYFNPAVPASLLFATALAYGRLIADREIAALKSFGCSFVELSLAPLVLGAAAAALLLILNFHVIPELRFTRDNLGKIIVERLRSIGDASNQSFNFGKYTIWIEEIRDRRLKGIFIAAEAGESLGLRGLDDPDGGGPVDALSYPLFAYAEEGEVLSDPGPGGRDLALELRRLSFYYDVEYQRSKLRRELMNFKQRIDVSRWALPVVLENERRNVKELQVDKLREHIAGLKRIVDTARRRGRESPESLPYFSALTEYHRRIAFAIVGLAFPLAAAALSLFLNSPNRLLPVFVSLLVATPLFYVADMGGGLWARAGRAPWFMMELGNLALGGLTAALFAAMKRRTLW